LTARPRIAVTTSAKTDAMVFACIWLGVRLAGGRAVRVTEKTRERPDHQPGAFDGLVIAGGFNVHPSHYGEEPDPDKRYDPGRDRLELDWAREFWRLEKPILAICRGMQLLNVARGGSILQILDEARLARLPSTPVGYMLFRKPVDIRPGRLRDIFRRKTVRVNSLHRQALDDVADDFQVAAYDEYKAVQGIESSDEVFRMGVQFHPELMLHRADMRRLFRALVSAAQAGGSTTESESRTNGPDTGP
jgi:putative glutamine amidotransferase